MHVCVYFKVIYFKNPLSCKNVVNTFCFNRTTLKLFLHELKRYILYGSIPSNRYRYVKSILSISIFNKFLVKKEVSIFIQKVWFSKNCIALSDIIKQYLCVVNPFKISSYSFKEYYIFDLFPPFIIISTNHNKWNISQNIYPISPHTTHLPPSGLGRRTDYHLNRSIINRNGRTALFRPLWPRPGTYWIWGGWYSGATRDK